MNFLRNINIKIYVASHRAMVGSAIVRNLQAKVQLRDDLHMAYKSFLTQVQR